MNYCNIEVSSKILKIHFFQLDFGKGPTHYGVRAGPAYIFPRHLVIGKGDLQSYQTPIKNVPSVGKFMSRLSYTLRCLK